MVDIANKVEHKFDDVYYRTNGEYLNNKALGLFKILPYFTIVSAGLFFFFTLIGFSLTSEVFFLLCLFLLSANLLFIYFMASEQPERACIGVVNEARTQQYKEIFSSEPKKIEYYAHIGTVVKEFLGKDEKESVKRNLTTKSNLVYDVAMDSERYCTGYLLPGSTGSGKTVALYTTVFLPAIMSGNGFWYIEGKGDKAITSAILSFIYQYGREQDTYIFDFGAATTGNYTNGINPLAIGNSKNVLELLKSLITIMTGENSWVSDMLLAFMGAILQPLCLLRDLNMMVKPDQLQNIKNFKDLKNAQKVNFNISTLLDYLNFQAAIDLLYMMRRLFDEKDFVEYVRLNKEYAGLRDLKGTLIGQLERNLRNANIDITTVSEPDYAKIDPEIQKFNIKAITTWVDSLTVFASEKYYGNVFNKNNPDLDVINAIQTNKIVIFILPSLSSTPEENKKIGGMAIALAKTAIGFMIEQGGLDGTRKEQARQMRFRPRKLPYAFVFDEPSNYANEDIPTMSSMVRSIGYDNGGMAIVAAGQSLGDFLKIDDGKGIKKDQLIANLGFTHCLNIQDEGYKKLMVEKIGEHYVYREDQYDGSTENTQIIRKREKEKKYEENYFQNNLRIKTGESIIHLKGYQNEEKMVTLYNEPPITDFSLNKFVSSYELMTSLKSVDSSKAEIDKMRDEIKAKLKREEDIIKFNNENLKNNFAQEVKNGLLLLLSYTPYKDLEEITKFTLELHSKDNPKAHGDYNIQTRVIRIYNCINKSREHLIATAIHELCHHIEYAKYGDTGHGARFYELLHELFGYALALEELSFNYEEAKEKKAWDSNDIEQMERRFGKPTKADLLVMNNV